MCSSDLRIPELRQIARLRDENDICGTRSLRRGDLAYTNGRITDDTATEFSGDLVEPVEFAPGHCIDPGARAYSAHAAAAGTRLFVGRQRLENFFGDIDPRAAIHRFLHDQIVFFTLGNLLDDAVRALEQGGQFLVAAQIEVFAELDRKSTRLNSSH